MGASDASLPASASLEEERPETTEGRGMSQEPLDPSQALDASYCPIYFEGKRSLRVWGCGRWVGLVGWLRWLLSGGL